MRRETVFGLLNGVEKAPEKKSVISGIKSRRPNYSH
jgi:hypothetical protein